MRCLIAVAFAFGAMPFTSCREAQQQFGPGSNESRAELNGGATVHPEGDVHAGHNHDQAKHVDSQAAQHGDVPATPSGHTGEQHAHASHSQQSKPHKAHEHANIAHETGAHSKQIAVGDKVPDFEVTIAGKTWKLSELQKNAAMTADGTLVLTFWCSFCHSCRHVEHSLDALAKQYQGQVGVIALDASSGETTEGVAAFSQKEGLALPIALDANGAAADIFGVRVTTTTVVIDGNGVLRYCGQFGDAQHAFAADALAAVLAGEQVTVQKTQHKG